MTAEATNGEVERLRAENEQLRAILEGVQRQNEILQGALIARHGAPVAAEIRRVSVQIGSRDRMAMLEHTVDVLDGFVQGMASDDCYGCDRYEKDVKDPQLCRPCKAEAALEAVKNFRYGGSREEPSRRFVGALYERTLYGWNPRETKHHRSWVKHAGNFASGGPARCLALILTDRSHAGTSMFDGPLDWPTPRDWYVATSVVQWLGTTIGSQVLEDAGWKYMQEAEDRAGVNALREAEERKRREVVTQECPSITYGTSP